MIHSLFPASGWVMFFRSLIPLEEMELVAGFGMAYSCPCLKMIRGVMPPKAVTYSQLLIGT